MADKKKVVVAFSGGLDTSYTVMKLKNDGYRIATTTKKEDNNGDIP